MLSATQEFISVLFRKKKKYHKTCKPMKGEAGRAECENKDHRKRDRI